MSLKISERSFEEAIECSLLAGGPDACAGDEGAIREIPLPYGEPVPGGYQRRSPDEYDRTLCLIPRDAIDFILATQPRMWERLKQHHGAEVRERFLRRLSDEIARRGTLDVFRGGIRDSGASSTWRIFVRRAGSTKNSEASMRRTCSRSSVNSAIATRAMGDSTSSCS